MTQSGKEEMQETQQTIQHKGTKTPGRNKRKAKRFNAKPPRGKEETKEKKNDLAQREVF